MKTLTLNATVTASNDRDAEALRATLRRKGTLLVNVMSSPGAGKTTLLSRLIRDLEELRLGVLEADIASDVDAQRIAALGAQALQVHTSGMCHMDAGMTKKALETLTTQKPPLLPAGHNSPGDCCGFHGRCGSYADATGTLKQGDRRSRGGGGVPLDMIFLENVGNLICPAEYDTGAGLNLMLLSVPEGDDKPLKYPLMFQKSNGLVITKTDALPWFDFDLEACAARAKKLNPSIRIFPVSAKTGDGMAELESWLREQLHAWRSDAVTS